MPFVTCPACGCPARPTEMKCPECDATIRRWDGTIPRTAAAAALGLSALVVVPACGDDTGDDGSSTTQGSGATGNNAAAYGVAGFYVGGDGSGGAATGGDGAGGEATGGAGGSGGNGFGGQAAAYGVAGIGN